jgi:hypothetical protein
MSLPAPDPTGNPFPKQPIIPCAPKPVPVAPNPEKPVKSEGVESNNAPEA